MIFNKTERGFSTITFKDRYNTTCSLQDSSIATESCIWFGVDDPNPQIMATDASKVGIKTKETTGWIPYPLPPEVLITDRMHLSVKQVEKLIPILTYFVEHGELPTQAIV